MRLLELLVYLTFFLLGVSMLVGIFAMPIVGIYMESWYVFLMGVGLVIERLTGIFRNLKG